jgi:hypothetical protein
MGARLASMVACSKYRICVKTLLPGCVGVLLLLGANGLVAVASCSVGSCGHGEQPLVCHALPAVGARSRVFLQIVKRLDGG